MKHIYLTEEELLRIANKYLKEEKEWEQCDLETRIKPTKEWMKKWYNIFNAELFDGKLQDCILNPTFTISEKEDTLIAYGHFTWKMKYGEMGMDVDTRQMVARMHDGTFTYLTPSNIFNYVKFIIELNSFTYNRQKEVMNTLIHEMCHYYNYMTGFIPEDPHGAEFKAIGSIIDSRSNNLFKISSGDETEKYMQSQVDMSHPYVKKILNYEKNVVLSLVGEGDALYLYFVNNRGLSDFVEKRKPYLDFKKYNFIAISDDIEVKKFAIQHYKYIREPLKLISRRIPSNLRNYPWIPEFIKFDWYFPLEQYGQRNFNAFFGIENDLMIGKGIPEGWKLTLDPSVIETFGPNGKKWNIVINSNGDYNLLDNTSKSLMYPPDRITYIEYSKTQDQFRMQMSRLCGIGSPAKWHIVTRSSSEYQSFVPFDGTNVETTPVEQPQTPTKELSKKIKQVPKVEEKPKEPEFAPIPDDAKPNRKRYRTIKEDGGYNLIDTTTGKKVFTNPVSELKYSEKLDAFAFKVNRLYFVGLPGAWKPMNSINEAQIIQENKMGKRHQMDFEGYRTIIPLPEPINLSEHGARDIESMYGDYAIKVPIHNIIDSSSSIQMVAEDMMHDNHSMEDEDRENKPWDNIGDVIAPPGINLSEYGADDIRRMAYMAQMRGHTSDEGMPEPPRMVAENKKRKRKRR